MKPTEILFFVISGVPISCGVVGWYFLFGNTINEWNLQRRALAQMQRKEPEKGELIIGIERMLVAANMAWLSPMMFLGGCLLLFGAALAVGIRIMIWPAAVLLGLLAGVIPVMLLYLRLEKVRKKASREGEQLISEFLRQYRIAHRNIYKTLEQLVENEKKTRITNKLVFRLLLKLRDTGNAAQIRKATEEFSYALDTNWGRTLGYNIYLAASRGSDISQATEDILVQLRDARNLEEERKRMNSESFRMTAFMVPITYVITVFMASSCLDIRIGTFLHNQICTAEGLLFFFLIVFFFLLNQAVLSLIMNQKFDY